MKEEIFKYLSADLTTGRENTPEFNLDVNGKIYSAFVLHIPILGIGIGVIYDKDNFQEEGVVLSTFFAEAYRGHKMVFTCELYSNLKKSVESGDKLKRRRSLEDLSESIENIVDIFEW